MAYCTLTSAPDLSALGIPSDIPAALLWSGNETLTPMRKCCAPNPVNIAGVNGTCAWCEIPESIVNQSTPSTLTGAFHACLIANGLKGDYILGTESGTSVQRAPSMMGLAVAAVVLGWMFSVV
ncbi:hypothetical protein BX600DRAFT_452115 [Xylariales sp. PMI_506]|nr:hypothetical protein BX600DRAFT_452115 [Xylariales sp. PMI_506]